ncbi:lipopolysaccharide biosynthesis protein [Bradyrhizobium betae]
MLARMLPPDEVGAYGLITATLAFALLGLGLEFYSYTLRELVPASPLRRAQIIMDQLALGAATFAAIMVFSGLAVVAGAFPSQLAPWFLLVLATEHISLEATRILIITSRPVRAYIGVFLRGGVWVYAITLLMFANPSSRTLETVLIWWALGGAASILFAAFSLKELPWREIGRRSIDWQWVRTGLLTARPFMLTAAGALLISYADRFLIDMFVGRGALGIYTFYSTIAIGILSLGASISQQFLPKVIAAYARDLPTFRRSVRNFFWSLLGVAGGMIVLAGVLILPLMSLLQLDQYTQGIGVFFLMLPGLLVRVLADVPSYALYAARADSSLLYCNLGSAVVSVALNLVFIPIMGNYGAALSGCIASTVLLATLTYATIRRYREDIGKPAPATPAGFPTDADMLYP